MNSSAFLGRETGDSQSRTAGARPDSYGIVALYASRLASTADERTDEKNRLASAEPVKFGRIARVPGNDGRTDQHASVPRSRLAVPPQILNVIAGHAAHPEPA